MFISRIIVLLVISLISLITFYLVTINVNLIDNVITSTFIINPEYYNLLFMTWISFLGSGEVLMVMTMIIGLWLLLYKQSVYKMLLLVVVMGGGVLLNLGLKLWIQRGRPDEVSQLDVFGYTFDIVSYSFPSGHAMRSFLFFGFLIYLVWSYILSKVKRIGFTMLFLIIIILIGFSRVILEAHFPSDIIGSFFISISWITICIAIYKTIVHRKRLIKSRLYS